MAGGVSRGCARSRTGARAGEMLAMRAPAGAREDAGRSDPGAMGLPSDLRLSPAPAGSTQRPQVQPSARRVSPAPAGSAQRPQGHSGATALFLDLRLLPAAAQGAH
jgi:hypothetical protein